MFFETAAGLIIAFVVKLILEWDNGYYEVIRYNSAHGCPHRDILDWRGKVVRKTWFDFLDNKQGLDLALKDLKDNSDAYVERFVKWHKG